LPPVRISIAHSSSIQSTLFSPGLATDGNATSRWSPVSGLPNTPRFERLLVDLGSPRTFNRVIVRWEAAYTPVYVIAATNDLVSWDFPNVTTSGNGGVDTIDFTARSARFVGVAMLQGHPTYFRHTAAPASNCSSCDRPSSARPLTYPRHGSETGPEALDELPARSRLKWHA
jgi:hypothetical protein